ncbi:MAG: hypothetical protein ABIO92_03015 [Chloroflexia bacterium]
MILPLDPSEGLIIVPVRVFGPGGEVQIIVRFTNDIDSTASMFDWVAFQWKV